MLLRPNLSRRFCEKERKWIFKRRHSARRGNIREREKSVFVGRRSLHYLPLRVHAGAPAAFLKKLYCLSPGSPSSQHVTPYYASQQATALFLYMKFYAIFRYISLQKATHFNGRGILAFFCKHTKSPPPPPVRTKRGLFYCQKTGRRLICWPSECLPRRFTFFCETVSS